jgi:C1A family cysteine protease
MTSSAPHGFGWQRDLPDLRDLSLRDRDIRRQFKGLRPLRLRPNRVDWREYFGPVYDQQDLPTSSAQACAGLLAYFQRRATGEVFEPSRMFLNRACRRLQGILGGGGPTLRTTWKVVAGFGVPSEECWPYDPDKAGAEPDAFVYMAARKFPSFRYVRLDRRGRAGNRILPAAITLLAAGFPSVFGFPVYSCVTGDAEIRLPTIFDRFRGGQSAVAVGYDDELRLAAGKGALLIRTSWGPDWGDQGYGWLPYAYVREGLAVDLWTILTPQWLASGEFCRP